VSFSWRFRTFCVWFQSFLSDNCWHREFLPVVAINAFTDSAPAFIDAFFQLLLNIVVPSNTRNWSKAENSIYSDQFTLKRFNTLQFISGMRHLLWENWRERLMDCSPKGWHTSITHLQIWTYKCFCKKRNNSLR